MGRFSAEIQFRSHRRSPNEGPHRFRSHRRSPNACRGMQKSTARHRNRSHRARFRENDLMIFVKSQFSLQNTILARFCLNFGHLGALLGAPGRPFGSLGRSWGSFGHSRGAPGTLPGTLWGALGTLLSVLGHSWGTFCKFLVHFGLFLDFLCHSRPHVCRFKPLLGMP